MDKLERSGFDLKNWKDDDFQNGSYILSSPNNSS